MAGEQSHTGLLRRIVAAATCGMLCHALPCEPGWKIALYIAVDPGTYVMSRRGDVDA